jgi:hypothetical protein
MNAEVFGRNTVETSGRTPPAAQHHILKNTAVATANLTFLIDVFASLQW